MLDAIDKVYNMRLEARDKLLYYLKQENPVDISDTKEITIHFPNSEFRMRVVNLGELLGEIEVPVSNLWRLQELTRAQDAS